MTTLRCILPAGSGAYLDYLFISLLQERKSEADALKVVTWVIENDKAIKPPIPPGSKPLADGHSLEIEFPDHTRFPAGVFFIPRVYYPINLLPAIAAPTATPAPGQVQTPIAREWAQAQARRQAQRAIHQQRLEQRRQQDRAILEEARQNVFSEPITKPSPVAPDNSFSDGPDEGKAAKWLALLLAKDPKTKKKTHEAECIRRFKIKANAYAKRVWRDAHIIADQPMRGNKAD